MRILAIETATEACSVALFDDGKLIDSRHELLGRGHAERLVPMIKGLTEKGRAEEIYVSLGPGSFTGVRIGLAVAQALGIAWNAKVRGYPTLALIASMALSHHRQAPTVCMNGGHGQWFVQNFDVSGLPVTSYLSLAPDAARADFQGNFAAGNRAAELLEGHGEAGIAINTVADARHALSLPSELLSDNLAPLYGRPPDAKLPQS